MSSQFSLPEHDMSLFPQGELDFTALPPQQWPPQWHPTKAFLTPQAVGTDVFKQLASERISFRPAQEPYRLGEPSLPIAPYREAIINTTLHNQAWVLSSETGSGKSSQVGLYLLEAGCPRVFVTQPRILAARELMERARQSLGEDHAHLAGYLTGNASDSDCHPDARLIYVTEELLFKKANRGQLRPDDVVINDEAHERGDPTIFFLGLMKDLLHEHPDMRLLVSSATIDTGRFARKLGQGKDAPAPILVLPGRTYPVTRLDEGANVADAMRKHMREGRNVLAFEPGVSRLRVTWAAAQSHTRGETVHMLYGDQSPAEQKLALNPADHHHVVASRIGETSITPENKEVVVDSGLSNLGGYEQGVRTLTTEWSSQATMDQRMGRVGRTKPGIYECAVPDNAPPPPAFEDRPAYDPPAIENSSVAAYIVELLLQGRRLEDLDLLEKPTPENLQHDYKMLRRLGAIVLGEDGIVLTDIGRALTDLPLDTPLARMLIEARYLAEADQAGGETLRLQVAAAAAVGQVNGILDTRQESLLRYLHRKKHQEKFSDEQTSDLLFQLDVFATLLAKQRQLRESGADDTDTQFEQILSRNDILPNRYYKAVRTFEELCRREALVMERLRKPDAAARKHIIACQIAGTEELFVQRSKQIHRDVRGEHRTLGRRSTIVPALASLVIGTAFDLRGLGKSGRFQRRFITGGSVVTLDQLRWHAPHRLSEKSLGHAISRKGQFVERKAYYFDGELYIGDTEEAPSPTIETRAALITAMMTGFAPSSHNSRETVRFNSGAPNATAAAQRWAAALKLEHQSAANLNISKRYDSLIKKTIRQSLMILPLEVTNPAELDAVIPQVYLNSLVRPTRKKDIPEIIRHSPDAVTINPGNDTEEYIPVTYKTNIAYITIPRDKKSAIRREDFAELLAYHDVKLRVATGKYKQFEDAFEEIEKGREIETAKRERRANARTKAAEAVQEALMVGAPVERDHRPVYDPRSAKVPASTSTHYPRRAHHGLLLSRAREAEE